MTNLLVGIIGVILGAFLTLVREYWIDYRARKRKAVYLAIRVTCMLEEFLIDCANVSADHGEYDQNGCLYPKVSCPQLSFSSLDVDWQSLPSNLMYEILNFPFSIEVSEKHIANVIDYIANPPDYDEFFKARQYEYSNLGLKAYDLAKELRSKYGLPSKEFAYWNPIEQMQRVQNTR